MPATLSRNLSLSDQHVPGLLRRTEPALRPLISLRTLSKPVMYLVSSCRLSDLDMGEDIGKLLENKDTVVARMLPPDYTAFNVVLGDLTKEVRTSGEVQSRVAVKSGWCRLFGDPSRPPQPAPPLDSSTPTPLHPSTFPTPNPI